MAVFSNRVKVSVTGVDANTPFTLGAAVSQFSSFSDGEVIYTALAETGEWEVGIGTVSGTVLTRDTVEYNHLNTAATIDFTGKPLQVAQTLSAEYLNNLVSATDLQTEVDNLDTLKATKILVHRDIVATETLILDAEIFFIDASSGDITLTLPDITGVSTGLVYQLKRIDSSDFIVTITTTDLIDNFENITLTHNQNMPVFSDDTTWRII